MPEHTTGCGPTHQKDKTQPHSPEHRHHSLPTGSLHNPLSQPYPLGSDKKKMGTTNLQPVKSRSQTQYVKQNETTEKYTADEEGM